MSSAHDVSQLLHAPCSQCAEIEKIENARFVYEARRTNHMTNIILPSVIEYMQPKTIDQTNQLSGRIKNYYDGENFLPKLRIVLEGVHNWNEKLFLFDQLKCCHIDPNDLKAIDFTKLNQLEKAAVIKRGIEHWPRDFYKTAADADKWARKDTKPPPQKESCILL